MIPFLEQLQHDLLSSLIVTSSQVRVGMPLPLLLCCISGLGPGGLRHGRFATYVLLCQEEYNEWNGVHLSLLLGLGKRTGSNSLLVRVS